MSSTKSFSIFSSKKKANGHGPTTSETTPANGSLYTNGTTPATEKPVVASPAVGSVTAPATEKAEGDSHGLLQAFRDHVKNGGPFNLSKSTLAAVIDMLQHKESIDDRKMLLEHGLVLLSRMDAGSLSTSLSNGAVKLLYNDLPHPAASFIGDEYAFRTADGSKNNPNFPELGKANTPYSRSVQQLHPLPPGEMPDAGLVFDTLLRREKFVKHPAGLNSLMFAFAALVIHTVFQTSHTNVAINETSSYVDLAPLYGDVQADQDKIRPKDGYGLLYPDVFSEDRLMLLPPACCVILVCFNRNHNYIAQKIYEINERGTYAEPSTLSDEHKLKQDEEIFQTARLCNIGWFGGIVFSDYFSAILGLVRSGSSWSLNPFGEIRNDDHSLFERGAGNACSVEFNCLYRWHATTSAEDEKWVEMVFGKLFDGKPADEITVADFKRVAAKIKADEPDIQHWTFGGMSRNQDGSFKDAELANILHNATEHPANAFGARKTPHVMRLHEIMGIESNRKWGVCSMNDFRKFLGLKPYKTFLEWNSDPAVAGPAEKLYGTIDRLELYVGLQAEQTKPVMPGAGLCPGYTVSRAILSDAIALTRGDRFFTADFTPYNLTAWGFADCQRDTSGAGFGSMLGPLFLRTLPDHFTSDSIYTWFPLQTPESMTGFLKDLKLDKKYDLKRPTPTSSHHSISNHGTIQKVIADHTTFKSPAQHRASLVIPGRGFFIAEKDDPTGENDYLRIIEALLASEDDISKFFLVATQQAIKEAAWPVVVGSTMNVDIVRDVLKYVPLRWAATELAGIPLKTHESSRGRYTESDLFDILGEIYTFIFLEVEPSKQMKLQEKVQKNIVELLKHIKTGISSSTAPSKTNNRKSSLANMFNLGSKLKANDVMLPDEHGPIMKRLHALDYTHDELANVVLAIMISTTVELTATLTITLNLLLGSEHDKHIRTALSEPEKYPGLEGYVYEALRIDPLFKGVFRIAQKDTELDSVAIKTGDRVFLDITSAHADEKVFVNPESIDVSRDKSGYLIGDGFIRFLGSKLGPKIVVQVMRSIFSLPNVRRGPGRSGRLNRFKDTADPLVRYGYLNRVATQVPWPASLVIQYDAVPVHAAAVTSPGVATNGTPTTQIAAATAHVDATAAA